MEREVPQTKDDSKDAPQNVVRLWDWIGPHEELVPFGRPGREQELQGPAEEASAVAFAAAEAPASASDFWGERAASVHDALQAPVEGLVPADAGAAAGSGTPQPTAATRERFLARLRARRRFARIQPLRFQFPARRRRIVVAGAVAIAVVAGAALALTSGGSVRPGAGAATAEFASVLTKGIDGILKLDLLVTTPRSDGPRVGAARHGVRVRQSSSRPRFLPEPVHYVAPAATTRHSSDEAATAQAGASNQPLVTTSESGSRPSHTSDASSTPVTPTGQSGALGPIQSPDG